MPPELGDLANLEYLGLGENQLSGEMPPELGNLTNLEWLFLSENHLSGKIPAELGNLTNLEYLSLDGNQLSGCVPSGLQGSWIGLILTWAVCHSARTPAYLLTGVCNGLSGRWLMGDLQVGLGWGQGSGSNQTPLQSRPRRSNRLSQSML